MTEPNPETTELSLEARLRRLDEIVRALDSEDLELEKALALFEEGIGHVRGAETQLSEAELRVQELLGPDEAMEARDMEEAE